MSNFKAANSENLLSINEAAVAAGVSIDTLRRWEKKGKIQSIRTAGGHRRFTLEEVKRSKSPGTRIAEEKVERIVPLEPAVLYSGLAKPQRRVVAMSIGLFGFFVLLLLFAKIGLVGLVGNLVLPNIALFDGLKDDGGDQKVSKVLADTSIFDELYFVVNVPAEFNENITAPNVVYSVVGGAGISVTGDQELVVAATDLGSGQNIFKNFTVAGQNDLVAGSNDDSLLFAAGSNISLTTDSTTNKLTIGTSLTDDAETLDDLNSTSFLRSDTSDSFSSGVLSFADGTFLDLSGVLVNDTASQGIILPQNTTLTNPSTGEGYLAWDTDDNDLYAFNGTSWVLIGGASGSGVWTDGGTITYLTSTTDDLAVGGTTLVSPLSFNTDENELRLGDATSDANDPTITFYSSDAADSGSLEYTDTDRFYFNAGDLQFYGDYYSDSNSDTNLKLGVGAGSLVSGAINNIAIGNNALNSITTNAADDNTAVGYDALTANTIGSLNTAVGAWALGSNTIGVSGTAVGWAALYSNTEGSNNTGIGTSALYSNVDGTLNTALGAYSLYSNTGSNNTAVGYEALTLNSSGARNTTVGEGSLLLNTTADDNTAVGYDALAASTGGGNTAFGTRAGDSITTGANNVLLGLDAGSQLTTESNQLYIDNTNTTTPLVYGEFDNDYLKINGRGEISNSTTVLGGKSALIVDQFEAEDIFTASASGNSRFTIQNSGNVVSNSINGVKIVDGVTYAQTCAGINAAIDALPAEGGEVFLPEATYTCAEEINFGASNDNVTLRGTGYSTIIDNQVASLTRIIYVQDGDYDTIKDLRLINNATTTNGITLSSSSTFSTVENVYIDSTTGDSINVGTANAVITESTITNSGGAGIVFLGGTAATVTNNYIASSVGVGIGNVTTDGIIANNIIESNSGGGIITTGDAITVKGNTLSGHTGNSDWDIRLETSSSNVSVTGNSMRDGYYGIYVLGDDNTVSGNSIANPIQAGIFLRYGDRNTIVGNSIADDGTGAYGIWVRGDTSTVADRNLVANNSVSGFSGTGDIGVFVESNGGSDLVNSLILAYNTLFNNETNITDGGTNTQITNSDDGFLNIGSLASDPTNILRVDGSSYYNQALAIFNETGSNDIFTASVGGTPRFTIGNTGTLDTSLSSSATSGDLFDFDFEGATTQTAALTGLDLDFTNLTSLAGSTTYGLHINDLAAQTTSTEYGIYQEGTNWDYGGYFEDDFSVVANSATNFTLTDGTNTYLTVDTTTDAGDTLFSFTGAGGGITSGILASFNGDTIDSGTGLDVSVDGLTTGIGFNLQNAANTLTSGTLLSVGSTSTAVTGSATGLLGYYNWNPGSTTTATGDLFRINIGANGNVGNLFNVTDTGGSLFSVSETAITNALPTSFTAAGDVSIAYDIQFTNQTASFIKSDAPLNIEAGESFESNDLTLKVYNAGGVIVDGTSDTNTGTGGLLDVNLDTTSGQSGIDVDVETITDSAVDTVAGIKINATQTSTDNDVLYGLHIADLAGTADAGNEYGIYQEGTAWDYGAYFEDDVFFSAGVTAGSVNGVIVVDGVNYAQTCAGINAAIDALPAGGGEVFLPEATYTCAETVTIDVNETTLRGAGKGSIIDASAAVLSPIITTNNTDYLTFRDFQVLGNAGGGGGDSILVAGTTNFSTFDNLYLLNSDQHAMNLNASDSNVITNLTVSGSDDSAVKLDNGSDLNRIVNSFFTNNGGSGVRIETSSTENVVSNNTFLNEAITITSGNNTVSNNSFDTGGVTVQSANNISITGNFISNPASNAVALTSSASNISIVGNVIADDGTGNEGILVQSGSTNIIISNNIIRGFSGGSKEGIDIDPGASDVIISYNKFENNTANILDGGTNTQITNADDGFLNIGSLASDPTNILRVDGSSYYNQALAIFNETGSNDIFTASAGGTPRFTIGNTGTLDTSLSSSATTGDLFDFDFEGATTQTGALVGLDIDLVNLTNDNASNLYGIRVDDFTSAGAGGNLYGIYQQGTNWDYGAYFEDDVFFSAGVTAGNVNGVIVVDGINYAQTCAGINAAIDALPAEGGEVFLPEATYTCAETIVIDVNETTIRGTGRGSIIDASAAALSSIINSNSKDFLTFKDFQLIGSAGGAGGDALLLNSTIDSLVDGLYITNADDDGILVSSSSSNITLSNLFITGSDTDGIDLDGPGNRVVNSYFKDNGPYGVNAEKNNSVVSNNTLINDGINVKGNYLVVSGNTLDDASITVAGSDYSSISNNTMVNTTGITVNNAGSDNLSIVGNTILSDKTGQVILLQANATNTTIVGNTIDHIDGTGTGILVQSGATGSLISNNVIKGMTGGGEDGIQVDSGAVDTVISYNKFENNNNNISDSGTNTQITNVDDGFLNIGSLASDPTNILRVDGSSYYNQALAIFNETGSNDIFTASVSGTPRFTIGNTGTLDTSLSSSATTGDLFDFDFEGATTQTGALVGLDIDLVNLTNDNASNLYGIRVDDFTSAGAGGNLYGIYQQGTNWDYGLYLEDAAYFAEAITNVLPAANNITIDAEATVNTGTVGIIDLDLDSTSSQQAINLDIETITDSGIDTLIGLDVLATQTSIDDDVVYGIRVQELAGTADAGNEYGIYQAGTAWDFGLYVEDDVQLEGAVAFGTQATLEVDVTTPSVAGASAFIEANGSNQLVTTFDDGTVGQIIVIEAGTTNLDFDCAGSEATINCGSGADILAGVGDIFTWMYDGVVWNLISFMSSVGTQTGVDLAEWFVSTEKLRAGEVVSVAPGETVKVQKSTDAYDETAIGIVSTAPGITLGVEEINTYPIALTGRVPVKMDPNSETISPGDFLTSSDTPGRATRATGPGYTIGKALEAWPASSADGVPDTVLVFVNLGYHIPQDYWLTLDSSGEVSTPGESVTATPGEDILAVTDTDTSSESGVVDTSDLDAITEILLENAVESTQSAQLTDLSVLGTSVLGDVTIAGDLQIGGLILDGLDNSVNAVGTLEIQSLGLGDVEFMGGLVTIDVDGNIFANEVVAEKFGVSGASAGTSAILAGENGVYVESDLVRDGSLVLVTPTTPISRPLFVSEKETGVGFRVEVEGTNNNDINFDWFIIDHK